MTLNRSVIRYRIVLSHFERDTRDKIMLNSVWATVQNGRIELTESADFPEGAKVLVTFLPDEENAFWHGASEGSLANVWDNTEDDVYAQLLDQ
jgi:hypothetical protein